MTEQERTGVKIADRIVFNGCHTFGSESPAWAEYYKDTAQRLKTELVGTTTYNLAGEVGEYVQFTPDGKVIYDPSLNSSKYNPFIMGDKLVEGNSSQKWVVHQFKG